MTTDFQNTPFSLPICLPPPHTHTHLYVFMEVSGRTRHNLSIKKCCTYKASNVRNRHHHLCGHLCKHNDSRLHGSLRGQWGNEQLPCSFSHAIFFSFDKSPEYQHNTFPKVFISWLVHRSLENKFQSIWVSLKGVHTLNGHTQLESQPPLLAAPVLHPFNHFLRRILSSRGCAVFFKVQFWNFAKPNPRGYRTAAYVELIYSKRPLTPWHGAVSPAGQN